MMVIQLPCSKEGHKKFLRKSGVQYKGLSRISKETMKHKQNFQRADDVYLQKRTTKRKRKYSSLLSTSYVSIWVSETLQFLQLFCLYVMIGFDVILK